MDSFLHRYKNILVLAGVLVAQIAGLASQIRRPAPGSRDGKSVRLLRSWALDAVSPPEEGLHFMGRGFRGMWSNYIDLRNVRQRNKELEAQVGRLQLEQAALLEDARQGQRLQQLLSFREHYISATVPAQVIGTSGTDLSRVLYIDKGAKDGLRPDMAVITPDGIVGKVRDVFRSTAQVLEISDQSSGAGVLLESTRLRGVLRGNALGQPQVINLLPDERIKAGERVITSGGDQIYPRGLPVGVVDRVVPDEQNPPYIDVIVKPAANLGRLEEVLVVTGVSDQLTAKEQRDLAQSSAAANEQRAADVLAERLPGVEPLPASAGNQPAANADDVPPAIKAPPALHVDRYSPDETPPAAELTPGSVIPQPAFSSPGSAGSVNGREEPVSPQQHKSSVHPNPTPELH